MQQVWRRWTRWSRNALAGVEALDALVARWTDDLDAGALPAVTRADTIAYPSPWVKGHEAFGLRGVLTPSQCKELIEVSEGTGHYAAALVNTGFGRQERMAHVRKSDRVMIDNPALAEYIFRRIRSVDSDTASSSSAMPERQGMVAREINERIRFLRYDVGGTFRIHRDGMYRRGTEEKKGDKSFLTMLLYLNDGSEYEGCRTRLYSTVGDDSAEWVDFPPTAGGMLIHDHSVLHSATPLISGRKYVIRSDIMYTQP
jgi:predicted 2-oxoglutarate/Fe(II)-dependent dioxygenase YbiX